jgi:manganese/zinc/iron transport system permease protein
MHALARWDWAFDGWIVLAGMLCAVAAALLGNFLVLRRLSLLGDAISHAVLPGLAIAFFVSGSRNSWAMFCGAVLVGVLTALATEWIRRWGNVDEGASLGVVFTSLFALGLVMIVQAADHVDLDPGCVLYGAIELTPLDTLQLGTWHVPRAVVTLGLVALVNGLFVLICFKELKLTSFDPALATSIGFPAHIVHYVLMILVAVTAVASFECVGNILVVAMFIVPPAAACLLTDRLTTMIGLSVLLAAVSAVLGHVGALVVPAWFGFQSTSTSGMMAVAAGAILALAAAFGPHQGIVVRLCRRGLLAWGILAEDVLALLYRREERGPAGDTPQHELQSWLLADRFSLAAVVCILSWRGLLSGNAQGYRLTSRGQARARELVRSHRLWEHYLVSAAGLDSQRIHDKAEQFEHFTNPKLRAQLDSATNGPHVDPHGRPIPKERDA